MELEELRARLSELDRQILEAVAKRQAVVEQIGAVKRDSGKATRDFAREKLVLDSARAAAEELGIPPAVAESLMELLIRSSLTRQERARVKAEGRGQGKRALVIGGAGNMGLWFVNFLDSQGFDITVADPVGPVEGFPHVADWRETDDDFDVTVVAAPIGVSVEILDAIAAAQRSGLIFDIGSLKSPLEDSLRRLAASGARVTSMHPMFGPDTELLSGRHVLFLEVGCPEATAEARQLFASTMAQQVEMDLEHHDRLIAYVLGLSHALNIAFFTVLANSGEKVPRLAELSSTTFDSQLDVANRVAGESPQLYFEIQTGNPHNLATLRELSTAVEQITQLVESGDESGFVKLMHTGREYLASLRNNEVD
jgi:chorismate mutase/prephenate dehydrogenase